VAAGLPILQTTSRSILSTTSGFISAAGFTHSLTPARNCTYGCTYCYVPTLHVFGGLKPEDWQRWGQFTTFKTNAQDLLAREIRRNEIIYCSPLVDPYQPAEAEQGAMRGILKTLIEHPPRVFVIQTRGPLVLRDIDLLLELASRTVLRVSFSLTTDDEAVRRLFEPHCEALEARIEALRTLQRSGIDAYATLAPLLPCDPEKLAGAALAATRNDLIGDPLHVRKVKRAGATTRDAAWKIARMHGYEQWFEPQFQDEIVNRIQRAAELAGRTFVTGWEGFSWLARTS
jgi:DNA repair photolyase